MPACDASVFLLLALTAFAAPYPSVPALWATETLRQLARPNFLAAGVAVRHIVRTGVHLAGGISPAGLFLLLLRPENKGFIPYRTTYCMGIGGYMAKSLAKEIDNKSREFYEFVMPAIDMVEDGNELVVTIDLPGFAKKDINLRITGNVLSINAKREQDEALGTVHYRHRPIKIEKRALLPIAVKDEDKVVGKATYENGVVTLKVPIPKSTNIPIT